MVNIAHVYNSQLKRLCWAQLMVICALFSATSAVAAVTFSASVDRKSVDVGESFTLFLRFEGGQGQPILPTIPGISVSNPSLTQHSTTINGGPSVAMFQYQYRLVPTSDGDLVIPSIQAKAGGATLSSTAIRIRVHKAPSFPINQPDGKDTITYARLLVPEQMYWGDTIVGEFKLYCLDARGLNIPPFAINGVEVPEITANGFTIPTLNRRAEQGQIQLNGRTFNTVVFGFAIKPVKNGNLVFGPGKISLNILSAPRRNVFNDVVFTEQHQTTVVAEETPLMVTSLPDQNKPATFNGAIGQFTMQMSANPTTVSVGDPITLRILLEGQGALENLQLPAQPAWQEFKTYTPSSKVEPADPLGLRGTKTFELVVSPLNAAVKQLPPFEFSYFDPETKAYKTLRSQAVPLDIKTSALTPQPTVLSANKSNIAENEEVQAREIVHIKPAVGTLISATAKPLHAQPTFWIASSAFPLLWLGALFYRRRTDALNNNPRLRRQKELQGVIDQDFGKLREFAAGNKSDEFFSTVFRLLQHQIAERADVSPSSITEASADTYLKPKGITEEHLEKVHQLFQTCDQARFAPVRSSHELNSYIPRVEETLAEIKKLNDEPAPVIA